jgi:hypothetical protein
MKPNLVHAAVQLENFESHLEIKLKQHKKDMERLEKQVCVLITIKCLIWSVDYLL